MAVSSHRILLVEFMLSPLVLSPAVSPQYILTTPSNDELIYLTGSVPAFEAANAGEIPVVRISHRQKIPRAYADKYDAGSLLPARRDTVLAHLLSNMVLP